MLTGKREVNAMLDLVKQETRNKLTDYWKNHEIKDEDEYAVLTHHLLLSFSRMREPIFS